MRISDWSSDVCSSDLIPLHQRAGALRSRRADADRQPAYRDVRINRAVHPFGVSRSSAPRSEEHTSELQSLMRISYAVFCLKKKIQTHVTHTYIRTKINID